MENGTNKTKEALIKSEKQYRSLINALPQYIYHLDKNLRYVAANKAYCEAYSVKQEEIEGKTSKDFFSEKIAGKYMASDRKVIETGKVKEYTEKSKSIGNEDKWVQVVKVPMKDNNGNVDGMLGIYWDITQSKKAEQELQKYHDHLEELVKERTKKIEAQKDDLVRFNKLFVGREFRIKELRDKVKELEKRLSE
ncbi:MAG: PAS domain-containing protein [Bacteroidales bacterium]|nr:PAS domain-containing protein [Bacteroidales bacterium]